MVDCACTNFPSGLGNVTIGASLLFGPSPVATHRLAVRGDAHIWSEGLFPLTLRGGDAAGHMFTSVIQFKAANDHGLWQLGSGGLNGTYQEFSLLDQVNGVYRLYFGPTGNTGIGTAGPATRMHVYSPQAGGVPMQMYLSDFAPSIQLGNSPAIGTAMNAVFALATGPSQYGLPNAGDARLSLSGSSRGNLYIDSNESGGGADRTVVLQPTTGNVGIGTGIGTPPVYKLDVRGGSAHIRPADQFPLVLDAPNVAGLTEAAVVQFRNNVGTARWYLGHVTDFLLHDYTAIPQTEGVRLRIQAGTGNVSIGPVSGTSRLTVKSADPYPTTNIIQALASNDQLGVGIGFNAIRLVGPAQSQNLSVDAKELGHLFLQTQATGNVGIGTTGPQAKLHVAGTAVVDGNVGIGTTAPARPLQVGRSDSPSVGNIRLAGYTLGVGFRAWDVGPDPNASPSHSFAITDVSAGATRLVIKADGTGNVGVGIATPQYKLHVNGPVRAEGGFISDSLSTVGSLYTRDLPGYGEVVAKEYRVYGVAGDPSIDSQGKVHRAVYG